MQDKAKLRFSQEADENSEQVADLSHKNGEHLAGNRGFLAGSQFTLSYTTTMGVEEGQGEPVRQNAGGLGKFAATQEGSPT